MYKHIEISGKRVGRTWLDNRLKAVLPLLEPVTTERMHMTFNRICYICSFFPHLNSMQQHFLILHFICFLPGKPLSVLDGIPIAIKDEIDCMPYPTTGDSLFSYFFEIWFGILILPILLHINSCFCTKN